MITFHKNINEAIISQIKIAKRSIIINVPWFTSKELFNSLIDVAKRNVNIRLIIEDDDINRNAPINHKDLLNYNGNLYWHHKFKGINHEKYCIIDNSVLIYGSFNWTYTANTHNLESIIIIDRQNDGGETIDQFINHFNSVLRSHNITPEHLEKIELGTAIVDLSSILKVELLLLESECAILQVQVDEISQFYDYINNYIYNQLYDFIIRKLELSKLLAEIEAKRTMKKVDTEKAQHLDEEINKWNKWKESHPDIADEAPIINEDLKQLYRKAAMLAHPDKFMQEPEKLQKANEIMQQITEAYKNKDATKLIEIINDLETGYAFDKTYQHINDTELLQRIIYKLQNTRDQLIKQLEELKSSELLLIYDSKIDKETYMSQLKTQLEKDILILETNLKQTNNG